MTQKIAQKWLDKSSATAADKDHEGHMALISKKVSLQGVPGFENIGYEEWAAQTKHEFENNVLKSVQYSGFKLLTTTLTHIMFKTFETVEANDGTVNAQAIEALLHKEEDGAMEADTGTYPT